MGLVPKKTKADYHIFRHISVVKVVGFIFTIAGASELGDFFVAAKLKIPFIIFCSIEFLILSGNSPSDPTKCFAAAWFDWIRYSFAKKTIRIEESEVTDNENVFKAKDE